MTSEVVVMNRLGVALASDSAATVRVGDGRPKVYNADKLFALSYEQPVGAMVYNNSALLGVPWETILKLFRKNLGSKSFSKLEDYAVHLLDFLNKPPANLFTRQAEESHFLETLQVFYGDIEQKIRTRKQLEMSSTQDDEDDVSRRIAEDVINETLETWRSKDDAEGFAHIAADFVGRTSPQINTLAKQIFAHRRLGTELQALQELASLIIAKDEVLHQSKTGLVIAGFGEEEFVPIMTEYHVGEIYDGRLKSQHKLRMSIDTVNPSVVKAFAEERVVQAYLNGIDPEFELKIIEDVADILLEVPNAVIDSIKALKEAEKQKLKERVEAGAEQLLMDWADELENHRRKRSGAFLASIAFLPKDELAHVASSLVTMTSFQKRMSIDEDETVGGPVDVAVISKCDGFVWIRRKHYFPAELNRHFFKHH
jgi:hypothetical protein